MRPTMPSPGDDDEDRLSDTGVFMQGRDAVLQRLRRFNADLVDMIKTMDSDRPPPPDTFTPPFGFQPVQRESQH